MPSCLFRSVRSRIGIEVRSVFLVNNQLCRFEFEFSRKIFGHGSPVKLLRQEYHLWSGGQIHYATTVNALVKQHEHQLKLEKQQTRYHGPTL
jgi:hypothetical protein